LTNVELLIENFSDFNVVAVAVVIAVVIAVVAAVVTPFLAPLSPCKGIMKGLKTITKKQMRGI